MVLDFGGPHIPLQRCADLVILSDTPKGRGVFATNAIPAHTIIDVCSVLVVDSSSDLENLKQTILNHYTYNWPVTDPQDPKGRRRVAQAVVFGLGSMFNHSRDQNVGWERNVDQGYITYRALRDIARGEELCISYGARLTFVDADDTPDPPVREEDGINEINQIQLD